MPLSFATVTARRRAVAFGCVALCLSLFVLRTFYLVRDPLNGWTRLIWFGSERAADALPRLQQTPHYVIPAAWARHGYDGQYYAQLAIDPALRDPALAVALDDPSYRARRIGVPTLAFCLGGGQPARVVQAYALVNLLGWFALLTALATLLRPWTGRQLLCLGAALLGYGVVVSMDHALTDLPAAALIFLGAVCGEWGRSGAFAAALLSRETSLLAVAGFLDWNGPWRSGRWQREAMRLGLAVVPLALWMVYVHGRFAHGPEGQSAAGSAGNFAVPLQAMCARFAEESAKGFGPHPGAKWWQLKWLWKQYDTHELLTVAGIFSQGVYLVARRERQSPFWRTGVCYLVLGAVLGPAVWAGTGAAARALLPMTLCFYLLLARERDSGWFWPFFLLGSLPVPFGLHEWWTFPAAM